jgi:hypothetical protein
MSSHTANVRRSIEQSQQRNARGNETTGGFYGKLTDKNYSSFEEMRHYERLEAMRRNVPTEEEAVFDNLPAEKIRELFEKASKSEQEKTDFLLMGEDLQTWKELHPEYIDDMGPVGAANMRAMIAFLHARSIKHPSLTQLEDAYESLAARGLLQLDQAVLAQQGKKRHQKRAGQIEARGGVAAAAANMPIESEEELEAMPLEEIRRRATTGGWLR